MKKGACGTKARPEGGPTGWSWEGAAASRSARVGARRANGIWRRQAIWGVGYVVLDVSLQHVGVDHLRLVRNVVRVRLSEVRTDTGRRVRGQGNAGPPTTARTHAPSASRNVANNHGRHSIGKS